MKVRKQSSRHRDKQKHIRGTGIQQIHFFFFSPSELEPFDYGLTRSVSIGFSLFISINNDDEKVHILDRYLKIVLLRVCVCVCVCVRERERATEEWKDRKTTGRRFVTKKLQINNRGTVGEMIMIAKITRCNNNPQV